MSYLTKSKIQNHKFKILKSPLFYIILGLMFLVLSGILHPFDNQYRDALHNLSQGNNAGELCSFIKVFGKFSVLILLAFVFGALSFRTLAYRIFAAFIIMSVIVWSFKISVHRERPNLYDHHSFPSGDSGTASALFVPIASQFTSFAPVAPLAIGAVAFLRNYDNYHYLSDVMAGIGFGIISSGLAMFFKFRRWRLFWSIKPRYFCWLAVFATVVFSLPPFFNWAFFILAILSLFLLLYLSFRKANAL